MSEENSVYKTERNYQPKKNIEFSALVQLIEATFSEYNSVGFNNPDDSHIPQHSQDDYIVFLEKLIDVVSRNCKEN